MTGMFHFASSIREALVAAERNLGYSYYQWISGPGFLMDCNRIRL